MFVKKRLIETAAGRAFFGSACLAMAAIVIAMPGISLTQRILLALGSCFCLVGVADAFVPAGIVIHSARWRDWLGGVGRIIFGAVFMQAPVTKLAGGLVWSFADWMIAGTALILLSHGICAIMRSRKGFCRPSQQ